MLRTHSGGVVTMLLAVALTVTGLVVFSSSDHRRAEAAGTKGPTARPWSFRPMTKPKPPTVADTAWPRDELDRFILAKLEAADVQPNADATRPTLLRRIAFDLTGLPPSEAELDAFLAEKDENAALTNIVDAYLASPRFGERWARHWLDVVRYADSCGRTWNPPFTYAWRYRDWVIDSLNSDLSYDKFVTAQLAGDLLTARTVDERRSNLTATGFLALGAHDLQGLSEAQFELDCVDDQIDVTTRAMLGLTVSCARCHDHKYDPISMRDYYALAGIFTSTRMLPGVGYRGQGNGYVDHELLTLLPIAKQGRAAVPTLVDGTHSMEDYQTRWRNGERTIRFTTDPNLAMGVTDGEIVDCAIRIKGDPYDRADIPPRGDMHIAGLPPMARVPPGTSGRLQLAKWIASPTNPLAARVSVNRVWLHLFGTGLVPTPDEFGMSGELPTHPELLDYLATRFIAEGWSIKRLVRHIVLSRTYRLSSDTAKKETVKNDARDKDAANALYWRANLRRLEWEPLRDSLLHVAGGLSLDRPEGIQVSGIGGKTSKSRTASLLDIDDKYRTVYLPVLRAGLPESFSTFDFPDPCQISGRRDVTTVAPQALFFMNDRFVESCAREAAQLALSGSTDDDRRITWIYRRMFGRSPTSDEAVDAKQLLADMQGEPIERWQTLVQALFATAEFRYVR